VVIERKRMKVYQVTDQDWVMATSAQEAREVFETVTDWEDEWTEAGYPRELSEEELHAHTFILDMDKDHEDPANRSTYWIELKARQHEGPDMFATSEY
jgi:hypothetical protein